MPATVWVAALTSLLVRPVVVMVAPMSVSHFSPLLSLGKILSALGISEVGTFPMPTVTRYIVIHLLKLPCGTQYSIQILLADSECAL